MCADLAPMMATNMSSSEYINLRNSLITVKVNLYLQFSFPIELCLLPAFQSHLSGSFANKYKNRTDREGPHYQLSQQDDDKFLEFLPEMSHRFVTKYTLQYAIRTTKEDTPQQQPAMTMMIGRRTTLAYTVRSFVQLFLLSCSALHTGVGINKRRKTTRKKTNCIGFRSHIQPGNRLVYWPILIKSDLMFLIFSPAWSMTSPHTLTLTLEFSQNFTTPFRKKSLSFTSNFGGNSKNSPTHAFSRSSTSSCPEMEM